MLDWYDHGVPGSQPPILGHIDTQVVAKRRQRAILANLKAYFKTTLVKDVDFAATEDYAAKRRAGEVGVGRGGWGGRDGDRRGADSTIRRELGALSAAASWCVKRRLMPADQTPQIELPAETKVETPWLTKEAIRTLFEKSEGKLRAFCRLTYYWGARKTSVERLLVAQIDLQHSRVNLHRPGAPVTRKRTPIVPIYPEIRKDIETLLLDTATDYLFGEPRNFYLDFVKLCRDNGIRPVGVSKGHPWPHLLRHSRATHMLMDGEDIYKVARLLGDTVATVERVYGHHSPDYLTTKSNAEAR